MLKMKYRTRWGYVFLNVYAPSNLKSWERIVKLSKETNINSFSYTNIPRAPPFYLQYYISYDASGGDGMGLLVRKTEVFFYSTKWSV